jgi:glutamine synthetase
MIIHVDYVWVDGLPSPLIRSKTKVLNPEVGKDGDFELQIGEWNFDGSSTSQATTSDSERILSPKRLYQLSPQHYVALCEVDNPDKDRSPHVTNHRAPVRKRLNENAEGIWIGFEQEFFLTKKNKNVFWSKDGGEPINDSRYYCSSGGPIKHRRLIREFANLCNSAGINIVGYNTEVSPGQWEYQVFAKDPLKAADDLWVSRYLLQLSAETYDIGINWHPKPHAGWNGSGCHTNFSTSKMRDVGGEDLFNEILSAAQELHKLHMEKYGDQNQLRMTGIHETSSYDKFSSGVASRSTSFRIPSSVPENKWSGYLEDRRPASNCDPYKVISCILDFAK